MSQPKLDKSQQAALDTAEREKVMVLTGGPGTGKTFTVNAILGMLEESGADPHSILMAAPTGKAALRMMEATGRNASTIHRLLEYSPLSNGFTRNEDFPLDADVVVIDESSMIDSWLFASLLRAIPAKAKLILVGDKDQLPSVGAGNVFRDLIESGVIPVAQLTEIHRQSENSHIPVNAARINRGEMPIISDYSDDFFVRLYENPEDARDAILRLMGEELLTETSLDPLMDIQLLCPQKKSAVGVFELGKALQERLNPGDGAAAVHGFRRGDKVIQMKNDYSLEVMNGEVGRISEIHPKDKVAIVEYPPDRAVAYVKPEQLDNLALGYGITIHKSQGSEWPIVVVPVHSTNSFMLDRNLLYTAITRAAKKIHIIGNQRGLATAVKKCNAARRYTALGTFLRRAFAEKAEV